MIFVAVGTQKFQLNRLLRELDRLTESGSLREEVFAQMGHSDYIPRHFASVPFLPKEQFEEKVEECSLLITHSGVGTIVSGVSKGKPVIVYPRLAKFGEHVDDHQLQIAESFSERNYVLLCREEDSLEQLIEESRSHCFDRYISQRSHVVRTVMQFLDRIPEAGNIFCIGKY